jgi:hypothetical protein
VFAPEQTMRAWEKVVDSVELGYGEPICKYLSDLSCREWLHEGAMLADAFGPM